MVIPAIDLAGGKVVQLVQGEREALARELEPTLEALQGFGVVQVVDLDAAKGAGDNRELVRCCCGAGFRVRVGGGIRDRARAEEVLGWGAEAVIVASAAFSAAGLTPFLPSLRDLGREHIIVALDARDGRLAVRGWRERLPWTPLDALQMAAPHCGGFLYTQVETEGLMRGLPLERVRELRAATGLPLSVAGGIASLEEIEHIEALGCDSVLGMALYTGKLPLARLRRWSGKDGDNSQGKELRP